MSELPSDILDIAADLAEQERAWRVSVARQAMQASEKPDGVEIKVPAKKVAKFKAANTLTEVVK